MKDQYYRELELEPGASPKDIKRAYFKLVRKFTPEKDPEKFRRIREAYEKLQENPEETGPSFQEPAEPFAKKCWHRFFSITRVEMKFCTGMPARKLIDFSRTRRCFCTRWFRHKERPAIQEKR